MSRIMKLFACSTRGDVVNLLMRGEESIVRFGPTVYITYDESTGQYRIGETGEGILSRNRSRSRGLGGRGWPKSEKVIATFPAPADRRERLAMETALIQKFASLGLPIKNREFR